MGEETILHCPASGTPEPEIVSISQTEKSPKVNVGEETILYCPASGTPEPEIVWLKNSQPIDFSLTSGLREQAGGKELHIHNAVVDYGGVYTCVASNSAGDDQVEIELEVWGEEKGRG